jgi:glucarate dehydratase
MKIIDIRATPVTVPLEAPLRHANGCHWGRFVRTIVEVETDEGIVGLGEMGGGGGSAVAAFEGIKSTCSARPQTDRAHAVPHRQPHRIALQQPDTDPRGAGVCLPRHPRPEMGVPVCDILGGRVRDQVPLRRTSSSATPPATTARVKCARATNWSPKRNR